MDKQLCSTINVTQYDSFIKDYQINTDMFDFDDIKQHWDPKEFNYHPIDPLFEENNNLWKSYDSTIKTPIGTGATLIQESGTNGYHHFLHDMFLKIYMLYVTIHHI